MKEIKDYSLLPHNTFGMDVKASLFVEYESVTELQSILSDKKLMAGNWLHIGGGSNLLFKGDYAGHRIGRKEINDNLGRQNRLEGGF